MDDYEIRERGAFLADLDRVAAAPLEERRAARFALKADCIANPALIVERAGWLLNGSYGYGSYAVAREVMGRPRMNRRAWLFVTIAALEWDVPSRFARAVWNGLPSDRQDEINEGLDREISEYETQDA